jgi:hypothetical protein
VNPRVAAALDAGCVLLFVVIGRRSHDEGNVLGGAVATALPFLLALAVGWGVGWRLRLAPGAMRFGVVAWLTTVVLGMLLRHVVFGRGTAASFVVVATVFLGVCLLGWRGVAIAVRHRRPVTAR